MYTFDIELFSASKICLSIQLILISTYMYEQLMPLPSLIFMSPPCRKSAYEPIGLHMHFFLHVHVLAMSSYVCSAHEAQ